MSAIDEVTRRRMDASVNNTEFTPIQLIRYLLDEMERGDVDPDSVLVICDARTEEDNSSLTRYRAGASAERELFILEAAKALFVRERFETILDGQ